jgi:hypothetical protein
MAASTLFVVGCDGALNAHLGNFYKNAQPTVAPTGAPTSSASCPQGGTVSAPSTPSTGAGTAFVDMTSSAGAATSNYGAVQGYIADASLGGSIPSPFPAAAPIQVSAGATLVFYNLDLQPTVHAATGIAGTSFPTSASLSNVQTGSAISTSGGWATGPISGNCYSQALTVPATAPSGTVYYFGDPAAYPQGVRDVVVVE